MDRNTQSYQTLIGAAFLLVSLVGCHSSVDPVTAEKARKAREWIRFNPSIEWGDTLDDSRWRLVLDSEEPVAEAMLQALSAVPLTDSQALELLAGESPIRPKVNTRPFLIRAVGSHVGTSGFEIHTNKNGDVIVRGEALSHHDIPSERRPIVVWLETPPHEIYLWFSVAA